jgi:Domain of unknown function (DUF4365)
LKRFLGQQNIKADLSYAYLHLIAARGGFSCTYTYRHLDDAGVDAIIYEDGRRLAADSLLTSFDVHVQLKATYQTPVEQDGCFSYSITVPRYDKLRRPQVNSPRILVVLYLPEDANEWLRHSEDCLEAKRCAYWVSLRCLDQRCDQRERSSAAPLVRQDLYRRDAAIQSL